MPTLRNVVRARRTEWTIVRMPDIRFDGRLVARTGGGRAALASDVAALSTSDPLRRFVAAMCVYAIELDERGRRQSYRDDDAAAFARELLLPAPPLIECWAESDVRLCERFAVPLAQLRLRRRELTAEG